MKYYAYFPGCSSSEGGAKAYSESARAVSKALDVELKELNDWNCCGSTPVSSFDELSSFCLSARDLALAEKTGLDLVTPCSSCYVILNRTNSYLKEYPRVKAKVDEALAAGGLKYDGTVKVRHLLDVFTNDLGCDTIGAKVQKSLEGLKVAPYYGCQIVRPQPSFDHAENPQSLDKLITSLGGDPTAFPMKSRCCGGSLIISEEDVALELVAKILNSAVSNGAQCLVTVCPLCQTNLDAYQGRVNQKLKTNFNLPILFFTQLMGIALGLDAKTLGLKTNIIPADPVLAKYL
ncbi:MAG: CoB--CoM heterodisulfide reductase iron-sulfur subunit B family protein [Chloroflexota bacterium]